MKEQMIILLNFETDNVSNTLLMSLQYSQVGLT